VLQAPTAREIFRGRGIIFHGECREILSEEMSGRMCGGCLGENFQRGIFTNKYRVHAEVERLV